MNAHLVERHFAKIGARARIDRFARRDSVAIDVGRVGDGGPTFIVCGVLGTHAGL